MIRTYDLPEPVHLRSDGDMNIVEGWLVPFGQVADVCDVTPQGVDRYREGFLPGSFTRMEQAAKNRGNAGWMRLVLDHDDSLDKRVGIGLMVEQRGTTGAWAAFKLHRSANLELVRSMIEDGYDAFSVEFHDVVAPKIDDDGVRWRRQVHASGAALTPTPAYEGARVLSLRDGEFVAAPTPVLDDTLAWLASL